ncbi:MAG: arylesterase [Paracoccaceae bacterium]
MIAISIVFGGNRLNAEPVTIAAMGDSLVHGYGLPAPNGFVPQLDSWLKVNGLDAILINAGVSGDTTAGGLARIDWTLEPDVDGLIVSLGGNDALRGIDPGLVQKNLDGILAIADARQIPVLLIGIGAPNNFGSRYREKFDAIFLNLSNKYSVLLYSNFLQALARLPDRAAVLEEYFQADAIHPNAEGVLLIVDDIGPSVADLIRRIAGQ